MLGLFYTCKSQTLCSLCDSIYWPSRKASWLHKTKTVSKRFLWKNMSKENIYYHTSLPKVHGTSCPHSLISVSVSVSVVLSTIDFSSWLPERKQCIYAYERGNTGIIKNTDFKARMSMCIPGDVSKFGYEYTSSFNHRNMLLICKYTS